MSAHFEQDTTAQALATEWRDADDRLARLERGWTITRLIIWPLSIVGAALLAHATGALPTTLFLLVVLIGSSIHAQIISRAEAAVTLAARALDAHTRLHGGELEPLVQDDHTLPEGGA